MDKLFPKKQTLTADNSELAKVNLSTLVQYCVQMLEGASYKSSNNITLNDLRITSARILSLHGDFLLTKSFEDLNEEERKLVGRDVVDFCNTLIEEQISGTKK